MERATADLGLSPAWVARSDDVFNGMLGWRAIPVPPPSIESTVGSVAAPLRPVRPAHVAILGPASDADPATRRASAATMPATTLPLGSPAFRAALYTPDFPTNTNLFAPFVYHEDEGVDVALQLWNFRALQGPSLHGDNRKLAQHLRTLERIARHALPLALVELEPLSDEGESVLSGYKGKISRHSLDGWDYRRPRRRLPSGTDRELDTASLVEGRFEMAFRSPPLPTTGQRYGRAADGAYAVELEMTLNDGLSRRISLPPRSGTRQLIAKPSSAALVSTQRVWSRVRATGDSVLVVAPMRQRTLQLSIPTTQEVLTGTAPGVRFSVSDKGRYGRWVARHAAGIAGLHDLLIDARSRHLIAALRLPDSERGTARQFVRITELESSLREGRAAGLFGPRKRQRERDRVWLDTWIDTQVSRGLLRTGVQVHCDECLAESFLGLDSFGITYTCPRCGRTAPVPARPKLGYQLAEVAHHFLDSDCDVSALAIGAMARRGLRGFSYDFDHHAKWPKDASPREFDFCGVIDGQVFVGESKRNGKFDRSTLDFLLRLAKAVGARLIVLASDTECEGGCATSCIRDLSSPPDAGDACLSKGHGGDGVRERVTKYRAAAHAFGSEIVVLCRGDLNAPIEA